MIATSKALIGYALAVATIYTGQTVVDIVVPASRWFEVQSVKISDTTEGRAPAMTVVRSIHKPFYGEWIAEVERLNESGSFTMVCQSKGQSNYSPSNDLPSNLDLNWWTYPVKCHLDEGAYRVETVWRVFPTGITPRKVEYTSNIFNVRKANP